MAISADPLDGVAVNAVASYLNSIRRSLPNDYLAWIAQRCSGKKILDVGAVEHSMDRMNSANWKHARISEVASKCVGVDILPGHVTELCSRGFDVRLCDATSDADLGERFELVVVGDVIEHVDSPRGLLEFCKRHLEPGGSVLIRTPNAHCFDYQRNVRKYGTDVSNLEHVSYISPTHMLELSRRAGLRLSTYFTLQPGGYSLRGLARIGHHLLHGMKVRHALAEIVESSETYSTIFVYELIL